MCASLFATNLYEKGQGGVPGGKKRESSRAVITPLSQLDKFFFRFFFVYARHCLFVVRREREIHSIVRRDRSSRLEQVHAMRAELFAIEAIGGALS